MCERFSLFSIHARDMNRKEVTHMSMCRRKYRFAKPYRYTWAVEVRRNFDGSIFAWMESRHPTMTMFLMAISGGFVIASLIGLIFVV